MIWPVVAWMMRMSRPSISIRMGVRAWVRPTPMWCSPRATVTTWGSTTRQILALRDMLVEEGVGMVVIESTGTYWKPFYYLLEDHLALTLVNAREAKTVPGRKTDVADAEWLADLGAHGL